MFKKRNSTIPFAFECALLFLAISVFGWGLHAKLSLYHAPPGKSTVAASRAKLSIGKQSGHSIVSAENQDQPRFTRESLRFAAFVFSLQGHTPRINLSQVEPGPSIPGAYNLHGPDLMRRPPPSVLS